MTSTLVSPVIVRVAARVLVPAVALAAAGCQAGGAGGGGGGGRTAANPADVVAGETTYNQVCAQCHGTPGDNDGDAPDLAGTTAGAIEAEVTGNNHGGGRIDGFLDSHYREMAAYLGDGGGNGGANGDDGGGFDGGEQNGGGADVNIACYFAAPTDIQSVRQSVQTDYMMGVSRDDEVVMMGQGCQFNTSVPYDDCLACGIAIVDEVYP